MFEICVYISVVLSLGAFIGLWLSFDIARSVMGYRDFYRKVYLHTLHWKFVRWLKFQQVGRKCKLCSAMKIKGTYPIDVHHKTYKHMWMEMFFLNDLEVLCRYHHEMEHRNG